MDTEERKTYPCPYCDEYACETTDPIIGGSLVQRHIHAEHPERIGARSDRPGGPQHGQDVEGTDDGL